MVEYPEFKSFPKIHRLKREIQVTEKIDGTNGCIYITETGNVYAGSRNRWLTIEHDNHGFYAWVKANEAELRETLGPGRHYGEWWGNKIQRGYDMEDKVFSLFNIDRWGEQWLPSLLEVVPVLNASDWTEVDDCIAELRDTGSAAAPGYMNPEGIVVRHIASGHLYKYTFGGDGHKMPKPAKVAIP